MSDSAISHDFPAVERIWPGCIQASICHAIMLTRYPALSHEQSWDGLNYSVQDSMGSRGTISFRDSRQFVAAFFLANSVRNPLRSSAERRGYSVERYLVGLDNDLRGFAEAEALQYLLQNYEGAPVPVITSAFWGVGECVCAAESWKEVLDNGACLVSKQLLDVEEGIGRWIDYYEMTPWQVDLARYLRDQKLKMYEGKVVVPDNFVDLLQRTEADLSQCRESLGELNIFLPD